ncbi:fimbrial major subunit CsuA/B family protein [Xylophilus rhododendri]|uniref:Fimbrial major subunit CsuA/B family protein n=1 Tax=Xylophilus rhododendri TaxID=2697032 RepID=A0A857IZP5_9BURK|nr:spore coat protein U domain-containing protein [Xylophilus rhododendri]QHI96787.1 fimbrial major subunit CsuA/B family protein [Xylophilus rhododendri]
MSRLLFLAFTLALLAGSAHAAVSCTASPAGAVSVDATVSNTSSTTPIAQARAASDITVSCTGDAGETFAAMQLCSMYAGLSTQSPYPFTLERTDGRSLAGSLDNRLAVYPLTASLHRVDSAGSWAGDAAGTLVSGGAGAGVTSVALLMDIEAPPGAMVESGSYSGTLQYTLKLVRLSGAAANDACNEAYPLDQVIATSLSTPITVTVPAQCTMTQPSTLDFGQQDSGSSGSLAAGVSGVSSSFRASCNNNAEKFNVWIDGGENSLAGQRRLKRAGSDDFIAYELLDAGNTAFPTAATGNAASQGAYTRSVAGVDVSINGRIPPVGDAAALRSGFYTDRVTVHVEY